MKSLLYSTSMMLVMNVGISFGVWGQNPPPPPPPPPTASEIPQPPKPPKAPVIAEESNDIIIRRKGGEKTDLHLVIDGDNIIINGKPLNEYVNDSLKIILRKSALGSEAFKALAGNNLEKFSLNIAEPRMTKYTYLGVFSKKHDEGLALSSVVKDGPAEKAGLKAGDIITQIDGKKMDAESKLTELIRSKKPGDKVKVTYKRNGKKKTTNVTLGEHETSIVRGFSYFGDDGAFTFSYPKGLSDAEMMGYLKNFDLEFDRNKVLRDLDVLRELEYKNQGVRVGKKRSLGVQIQDIEETSGVKVIKIEKDSPADKSGVKENDIITEINGKTIKTTDDARSALKEVDKLQSYKIKVLRNDKETELNVVFPKEIKTVNL